MQWVQVKDFPANQLEVTQELGRPACRYEASIARHGKRGESLILEVTPGSTPRLQSCGKLEMGHCTWVRAFGCGIASLRFGNTAEGEATLNLPP